MVADRTAPLLHIYVDNSFHDSVAISNNAGTVNSTLGFGIGGRGDGAEFLDGSVDEVGIWNRTLTAGERTTLWNSGSGVTYPF